MDLLDWPIPHNKKQKADIFIIFKKSHLDGRLWLLGPESPGQNLNLIALSSEEWPFPHRHRVSWGQPAPSNNARPCTADNGKEKFYQFWSALGNHRNGQRVKATWPGLSSATDPHRGQLILFRPGFFKWVTPETQGRQGLGGPMETVLAHNPGGLVSLHFL